MVYFILSKPNESDWSHLNNEIKIHDDIIVTDLEESYDNLVYKVKIALNYLFNL